MRRKEDEGRSRYAGTNIRQKEERRYMLMVPVKRYRAQEGGSRKNGRMRRQHGQEDIQRKRKMAERPASKIARRQDERKIKN